jgi:hypothetical protein
MDRGRALEKLIGEFGCRFFMKDFVWWDVKYISGGKLKQHPADLLLVLDGECVVVSVKGTDGETKAPDRLKLWLEGKVWDGSKSAKTGIQRVRKLPFEARNFGGGNQKLRSRRAYTHMRDLFGRVHAGAVFPHRVSNEAAEF